MPFKLEIESFDSEMFKLSVHNTLDNEQLAEIFMAAFRDMREQHPMVLRVIFFASMENLRPESEFIQQIWNNMQESG